MCAPAFRDMQSLPVLRTQDENGNLIVLFDRSPEVKKEEIKCLDFKEEPCGFREKQGFGFLQVQFGDRIGLGGRYEVLRKLGWGMQSSIWLAKDTVKDRFVAIKALNGYTTTFVKNGKMHELEILRCLSSQGKGMCDTHCLVLLDDFIEPGKGKGDGEHLCTVTDALGSSVSGFRRAIGGLTKPLTKKILRDTLKGLESLHSLGIVHTDLHPSNILADLGYGPHSFDIGAYLNSSPPERHPPELSWGGEYVQVAVSQPFPTPPSELWESLSFILADFGASQFLNKKTRDHISPIDQRAPETFLRLPWDEKVDIWSFGCLVFRFINDQNLFKTDLPGLPPDLAMMYQILLHTDDRLPADTIRSSPLAMKYLDPETGQHLQLSSLVVVVTNFTVSIQGWLTVDLPRDRIDLYEINKGIGALNKPSDLDGGTALMRKCLRLDPKDRASAKELLQDPWLNSDT
ncbi:hypothetical protein ACEPAI_9509 [Sanghuangporus weigelae]